MTQMTFNADLAERVLAKIRDEPEGWDQDSWENECGTTRCFAGWALHLSGQPVTSREGLTPERAAALLGIGEERRWLLFGMDTDLDQVEATLKHFANNPTDDSLPPEQSPS